MMIEPKLRFKADDGSDFPDWEEKTLGDEGKFYGGLSGKTKEDFETGDAHFVTYMNVYKNAFASQDMMGCVNVGANERQNRVLYGDLLFTQSSETVEEVGLSSVYLHDDEPYLNSFCMGYRFNSLEDVSPEFIGYCMRSGGVRKSIMLVGQGISRINLGAKRLETVSYRLPSLPEQRKIADLLSAVDDVISAQEAEVAAWEKRKKGVMQKLFSQEVRFKADDGSDFPDWEEKTLGDVGSVAMCKRVFKEQTREVGDVPFFKIGTFGDVPDAYISKSLFDELKSKYAYPKVGTILLSASGTIGRQVEYNGEDAYYQDSNIVWLEHDDTVLDSYLKQFYSVVKWQGLEGSTIKRLYNKTILDTPFYRPSLPEQRKIAECLALLDDVIAKAKDELDAWRELKKGLLQQMFV